MVFFKFSLNKSVTRWILPLCILLITFVIYTPSLKNGFVNFDDYLYVYENPNIQKIDLRFFKWVFTAEANPTWHPLTLLSIAVDYSIWGLNPFGYHLTNVVFHAINTGLAFSLFIRLCNVRNLISIIPASVASLLFGIHPLHVESVAWISERKDVLCAFFYLLSLLIYLKYISTKRKKFFYYTLCLFFFTLALISKPMAVSLPIVLLILDFYPLERLNKIKDALPLLIEKIPFLILSLILSIITINFHQMERGLKTLEQYPLIPRILVALFAYVFYLIKTVFPYNLAPFYPFPAQTDIFTLTYLISGFILAVLTLFSVLAYKKNKVYLAVWGYYLVTLLPTIGIARVGNFAAADRYMYIPSLGLFLLAGLGFKMAYEKAPKKLYKGGSIAILIIFTSAFAVGTVRQFTRWHDSITLWTHEVKLFPTFAYGYYMRGNAYCNATKYRQAVVDLTKAIELDAMIAE